MTKYIDAEKLKELIDEKWKELADKNVKVGGGKWDAEISTYLSVLRLIDSLQQEQPEIDLEEEIATWIPSHITGGEEGVWKECREAVTKWAGIVAHHFYELGLKAKEESK